MFNSKCVKEHIPANFKYQSPPIISYTLCRSIRSKLLNYKQTVDEFSQNHQIPACKCNNSSFVYADCGHVVTGDLHFLNDSDLINLFNKGPNYRKPVGINWNECLDEIISKLKTFSVNWCKREKAPISCI